MGDQSSKKVDLASTNDDTSKSNETPSGEPVITAIKPAASPDEVKEPSEVKPIGGDEPPKTATDNHEDENGVDDEHHDPHFEPIVVLPEIEIPALEQDEEELCRLRAKLYRYESRADPPEWKERGTGDMKVLRHETTNSVRVLMRRDKTLKVCANHKILPDMELKPHMGNEKAFVWSTPADLYEDETKPETFAVKFGSVENAQKFKAAFEKGRDIVASAKKPDSDSPKKHEEGKENTSPDENEQAKKEISDVADKVANVSIASEAEKA